MRKMLAIIALVLMCGCSAESEPVELKDAYCNECNEYFTSSEVVKTLGDTVCAYCLSECEYQTCRNCGGFYGRDWYDCSDGYCATCSEVETWSCAYCEDRIDVRHMVEVQAGYFVCADCLLEKAVAITPDLVERLPDLQEILVSRNEYLAKQMVESIHQD